MNDIISKIVASRKTKPFLKVNCSSIPTSLIESTLFGHVKGSFTAASSNRSGKFELADGGTLFLDEIGELPLSIQAKLLRAIQNGDIQRVGSDKHIQVDVRLVAATNRDLQAEVQQGKFREDLYHRLSVYPVNVPPLRERSGDIELLVGYFIENNRIKLGLQSVRLDPRLMPILLKYSWPGNVRELEHIISRAMLRAGTRPGRITTVMPSDIDSISDEVQLSPNLSNNGLLAEPTKITKDFSDMVDDYKRNLLMSAFKLSQNNWNKTAQLLNVDKSNIHRLGKRLGLK